MTSSTTRGRRAARVRVGTVLTVSAALAVAACSGGGGSEGSDGGEATGDEGVDLTCAVEDFQADEQFTSPEPMELGILWTDWPDNPITDQWEFFDKVEELTNVRLVPTNIPFSDATEKRSLLISAGDAPPLIPLVYTGEEKQFAASGAVIPLSDYAQYMPNFAKYVEEWDLGQMVDYLRQADGKYYMTPGLQEVSVPVFTMLIRKDIFDEVGAGVPETWDELRDALVKIKEKYPDSTPLADGFEGQSMLNYASHAFGTVAGWGFGNGTFYNAESGQFEYAATNDGYKAMVEYFNGLVQDGLLDTESFTASDEGGGTVTEKFAAETVFAASGSAGTVQDFESALQAAGVDDAEVLQIAPPGGDAGQIVEPRNFWNGFMLTSQVAEDPDLCSILQFSDWLYYNPQARELIQWGVEGETYTKSDDGTFTLEPGFSFDAYNLNPDGETDIQIDLGYASNVLAGSTESRELKESYNSANFVDYIDTVTSTRTPRDPFPPAPLDELELEQASLLSTPLKDTVDTATLQFILGDRDLSEWDAYVSQLEGQGLQQYLDLVNGAAERYAEANG
jgi:putative aldouronate transport system substrate-binding protein